ncbi:MAG: superoxide dismutase family protein [Actinomycetota bacterium]|nr:superoxide dismutase family protein [Actinomycetota bacterium]
MKKSYLAATLGALALVAANPAQAQHGTTPARVQALRANLAPVPHDPAVDAGSNVTGRATLVRRGNEVRTILVARGLTPHLPHAMHIHGELQARNECPSLAADKGGDGLIDTVDGLPDYGPIDVSLTTSGGTSGDFADALALDRFPVPGRSGVLIYDRSIEVPAEVAANLQTLHIVVHGADLNGTGDYDFGPGTSSLSPLVGTPVPLEAELPVACGRIE